MEIRVPVSASLTANGRTEEVGSMTWSAPSLPEGVAGWDSIKLEGSWSWTGRGAITHVSINDTNTTTGVAFSVDTSGSPQTIRCVGNNNATGNSFTWNVYAVYSYTAPDMPKKIKYNGVARTVKSVMIKRGSSLVKVSDDELPDIINNGKYILGV